MGNVNAIHGSGGSRGGRSRSPSESLKSDVSYGWDEGTIQKLLSEGKLAARSSGRLDPIGKHDLECPICFLYYKVVNSSTCCHQPICTECYLKVRQPRRPPTDCPFCGRDRFSALVSHEETKLASSSVHAKSSPVDIPREESKEMPAELESPVASVEERAKLEERMRAQLEESRRRGDSISLPTHPPPARDQLASVGGIGAVLARSRDAAGEGADLSLENLHALLHSLPTDLQQVEDLMILEAMQASIQDEERRQREQDNQQDEDGDDDDPAVLDDDENDDLTTAAAIDDESHDRL